VTSTQVDGIAAARGEDAGAANLMQVDFVSQGKFWQIQYRYPLSQSLANPQYLSEFNAFVQSFKFN
jgi:hypothetical protein